MSSPVIRAAAPAAARAGMFLAIGLVLIVLAAWWTTDGFSRFPDWSHFSQWVQDGGRP